MMPTTARLAGFAALFLLSTPVKAQSFVSSFEYHSFWSDVLPIILMAALAVIAMWFFRRKVRKQLASAPKEALRSPQERCRHRLSLFFIAAPMFYPILFDASAVFTLLGMLMTQSFVTVGSRALRLPFRWRIVCILPASLLSIFVGELIASWPNLMLSATPDQVVTLTACAASFAIGTLLSYLSFPPAFRSRAW